MSGEPLNETDVICPCGHNINRHGWAGCDAYVPPRIGGAGACCTRTPVEVVAALSNSPGTTTSEEDSDGYAWGSGLSKHLPLAPPICGVGGPREASSDCIRTEGHGGQHEDSCGGTWPVAEQPRHVVYSPGSGSADD